MSLAVPAARANDEYFKRLKYDFEKCANACQIDMDRETEQCSPFRQDKSRETPETCELDALTNYEKCKAFCPADPRPLNPES